MLPLGALSELCLSASVASELALDLGSLWRACGDVVVAYNDALRSIFAPHLEAIYGGRMASKHLLCF